MLIVACRLSGPEQIGLVVQWSRAPALQAGDGGSIPSGVTDARSAGVSAAHLLGKEGDRVQFPGGPLDMGMGLGATGLSCTQPPMGSIPFVSTALGCLV